MNKLTNKQNREIWMMMKYGVKLEHIVDEYSISRQTAYNIADKKPTIAIPDELLCRLVIKAHDMNVEVDVLLENILEDYFGE